MFTLCLSGSLTQLAAGMLHSVANPCQAGCGTHQKQGEEGDLLLWELSPSSCGFSTAVHCNLNALVLLHFNEGSEILLPLS